MERRNEPMGGSDPISQSIREFELVVKSLNALFDELGKQYLEHVPQPSRKKFS
ncbi:MAG: hypothetical protein HQL63_04660 [Magnetococcales bacterium]|nr:hypothetical protein [Magnetococcales bacterium]MBF0323228.1 hypothetical protein [Magnetococcales bacterium]